MRENQVEKHLRVSVERLAGTCEKFVSPGRRFVPDRQVNDRPGHIDYVETKAPRKKPSAGQLRDHARRRARGFRVFVLDTIEKVDHYMEHYYGK